MKTLHSLTSRGRVRVFFEGENVPGGAPEGGEEISKNTVIETTRNYLAALVLGTLVATTAQAQTTEPTQVAAADVRGKCDAIVDPLTKARCLHAEGQALSRERAALREERVKLEQQINDQKVLIAQLRTQGRQTAERFWGDLSKQLKALEEQISMDGVLKFLGNEFNDIFRYIADEKIGDWHYADVLYKASQRQ